MAVVVIQRGHYPRTTGATGAPGEQAFTKAAADRCALHLGLAGHQVRVINADVPNSAYEGDLFVALHYDSSKSASARGASVGWQTPEGNRFAQAWKRHYKDLGWTGGFREDNYTPALKGYYGVKHAVEVGNRRAFIAEAGFHSNPQDAALLASPGGPDRVGRAVAAAVVELVGGSQRAPVPVVEESEMPDVRLFDCAGRPALLFGAGDPKRLTKVSRQAIRDIGIHPEAISVATHDGLASLIPPAALPVDVDEAAIAAVVTAAVIEALPDEVTEELTAEDVEAAVETGVMAGLGSMRFVPPA